MRPDEDSAGAGGSRPFFAQLQRASESDQPQESEGRDRATEEKKIRRKLRDISKSNHENSGLTSGSIPPACVNSQSQLENVCDALVKYVGIERKLSAAYL